MTRELLKRAEDFRRTGSAALDLAWTAVGRFDGYFETGLKVWDMAAGCLLVREAGGRYCDFVGREGLPESGNLVAGNHVLATQIVETIAPILTSELKR
jgi:myo-inositol-1(or 4)-monophosphatase